MIGFPFDSHVSYEDDGTPVYDRAISSEPLRNLIHKLFSDGILPTESTNLQVVVGSGMNVIVKAGFAIVRGCMKLEETDRTLAIQASDSSNDRIDTVVLRLNSNDDQRYCDLYVLKGTPATSPVRPELTRTDSVYELGLADIFITKNTATITQQRITDTRYETERCGVISSVSEFDTTTIYKQVQADLKDFKTNEQADFMAWYEEMKNILDESTAGNLLEKINANTTAISSNASAIKSNTTAIATKQDKILTFTNKTVATSAWSSNSTVSGFGYRASIALSGVTANHLVTVIPNQATNDLGILSVEVDSYSGGVYIYAKSVPSTTLLFNVIKAERGG